MEAACRACTPELPRFRLTDSANAEEHSAAAMPAHPMWMDASPDEQAVSIEYEGPCKPWKKDRRPQATLRLKEVTEELVRAPP